jgi:hypothetical protein
MLLLIPPGVNWLVIGRGSTPYDEKSVKKKRRRPLDTSGLSSKLGLVFPSWSSPKISSRQGSPTMGAT